MQVHEVLLYIDRFISHQSSPLLRRASRACRMPVTHIYGNWRCVEAAKKKKNKKKSKSALSKEVKKLCKKAKGKSKCKKGIAKQYCTFNKKKSKCQPK